MRLYAESSAVLSWLLAEEGGLGIRDTLSRAEGVFASTLTVLECRRALARGEASKRIDPTQAREARTILDTATQSWLMVDMTGPPMARAAQAFPKEPVRTLDAIHLATALETQAVGKVAMLSLDDRIRANAAALGLEVLPEQV